MKMAEGTKIHVGVDGLHADLAKTGIPSVYLSIIATERIFNVNGQPSRQLATGFSVSFWPQHAVRRIWDQKQWACWS